MAAVTRPSLARPSLFSVSWYASVLAGWLLLAVAVAHVLPARIASPDQLAMTAVLLVLLELRPVVASGRHDPQGVVMSIAFVCAMLFMWGLWPAVVVYSLATLCSELRQRKALWKLFFNVGQCNVSITAGWLVMLAAGVQPSLAEPLADLRGVDLIWIAGVWVAYYGVNNVLVSGVLAHTCSFKECLLDDIGYNVATTFAVLTLSPIIVIVAQTQWVLLPLLLVPLLLVYATAALSLEKEHQATHDSLTGLPNRTRFHAALDAALAGAVRERKQFGLLLIDLDHFKEVNDTLGHQVGDRLLVHFAERLRAAARPNDMVARLGGDEFALIIAHGDSRTAYEVAERIRLRSTQPLVIDGMTLDVEASIGVAVYPTDGSHADELLRRADVAMYEAKLTRSGVATYNPASDRNSADRLALAGQLRKALDTDDVFLYYQPKVSLLDGEVVGMEALVRWRHPEHGLVPPEEFVPIAERSGMVHLLTERVLTLALRQLQDWQDEGLSIPVAVNISLADLVGSRLVGLIVAGLEHHQLPASLLQLEVTERVVAQNCDDFAGVLEDLRRLGIALSLDDFGTGYSSLLRLQSLPVSELKIAREFVARLSGDETAQGIVRSIIELAHALGMPAVAEGVERAEELAVLGTLGCDAAQGYFIARPMPPADAGRWLHEQRALASAAAALR